MNEVTKSNILRKNSRKSSL